MSMTTVKGFFIVLAILGFSMLLSRVALAQRQPPADAGEVGSRFPFGRGENAIFNFDEGDEQLLETVPPLVNAIYKMVDVVSNQRRLTADFAQAFEQCEDCKF